MNRITITSYDDPRPSRDALLVALLPNPTMPEPRRYDGQTWLVSSITDADGTWEQRRDLELHDRQAIGLALYQAGAREQRWYWCELTPYFGALPDAQP